MCVTPGPDDRHVILAFKNPRVDNPAAVHEGLGVTASNCAEVLVEYGIHAEARPVVDGYYLTNQLKAAWRDATHVILCAPYVDTPFLEGLCRQFPHIEFAVNYHSNVGFLQADNWAVKVLREQIGLESRVRNFRLAVNCEKLRESVERGFGAPCLLLPNLYFLHGPVERRRAPWSGPNLHIGAFGATRQLKNLLTAAWAAIIMGRELHAKLFIHVSEGREEGGKGVMKAVEQLVEGLPKVELVREQWRPWLQFRMMMRRMNLLLQVSHTESFNGVTADGIVEGVPTVVSPAIDWVPASWIANPDKACEIADVGKRLLADPNAIREGYEALAGHNDHAIAEWKRYFGIHEAAAPELVLLEPATPALALKWPFGRSWSAALFGR